MICPFPARWTTANHGQVEQSEIETSRLTALRRRTPLETCQGHYDGLFNRVAGLIGRRRRTASDHVSRTISEARLTRSPRLAVSAFVFRRPRLTQPLAGTSTHFRKST